MKSAEEIKAAGWALSPPAYEGPAPKGRGFKISFRQEKALPLPREGRGGLKLAFAEGDFHNSKLPKSWQNSEKTGKKAAIFGQKADKTEQRGDKKGKGTDKLGVRKNT